MIYFGIISYSYIIFMLLTQSYSKFESRFCQPVLLNFIIIPKFIQKIQ